jgi:exonuclease I
MLTLLELRLERLRQRIHRKLPQASESVLEQVWTILNATNELSESANEDKELYDEFERWEAASDEDEAQIEAMLAAKSV